MSVHPDQLDTRLRLVEAVLRAAEHASHDMTVADIVRVAGELEAWITEQHPADRLKVSGIQFVEVD